MSHNCLIPTCYRPVVDSEDCCPIHRAQVSSEAKWRIWSAVTADEYDAAVQAAVAEIDPDINLAARRETIRVYGRTSPEHRGGL